MKQIYIILFLLLFKVLAYGQTNYSFNTFCTGIKISLTSPLQGTTYEWSGPNGFNQKGNKTITISEAADPTKHNGTYKVLIDGETIYTFIVTVGKLIPTKITYKYSSTFGGRQHLYAEGAEGCWYSWSGPNGFIAYDNYVFVENINKSSQGFYKLTTRDKYNCVAQDSVEVKFSNPDCPYRISVYGTGNYYSFNWSGEYDWYNFETCEGTVSKLRVDTVGFANETLVTWYKNGKEVGKGSSISTLDAGEYFATISTPTCQYKSQIYTRKDIRSISAQFYQDNIIEPLKLCDKGGELVLDAKTAPYQNLGANITYQWYKDGAPIEGATSTQYKVTQPGVYQYAVASGVCSGVSPKKTVISSPKPNANLGVFFNNLSYDTKEFKLCDKNISYYFTLSADGEKKMYKDGQPYLDLSSTTNRIDPQGLGTYVLESKQGECVNYDTLKVSQNAGGVLPVGIDQYYDLWQGCGNPNLTISPIRYTGNSWAVEWYRDGNFVSKAFFFANPQAGNYIIKARDLVTGCNYESSPLTIKPTIGFFTSLGSEKIRKICKGGYTKLSMTTCVVGDVVWKKDGVVISRKEGINCSLEAKDPGKYWAEYTRNQCTYFSDTITVEVSEIKSQEIKTVCGVNITQSLEVEKEDGMRYLWMKNGIPQVHLTDAKISVPPSATSYGFQVLITNSDNCTFLTPKVESVLKNDSEVILCSGSTLVLNKNGGKGSYSWNGPNQFSSNLASPSIPDITKAAAGVYTVSFLQENSTCKIVETINVVVNLGVKLQYPSSIEVVENSQFVFPKISNKTGPNQTFIEYISYSGPDMYERTLNWNYPVSIDHFEAKNAGTYTIKGITGQGSSSCQSTAKVVLSLKKDATYRGIVLDYPPLRIIENSCPNTWVDLAFRVIGSFPVGTKFVVNSDVGILGVGTSSPIKVKTPQYRTSSLDIWISTEDGAIVSAKKSAYFYFKNENENASFYPNYGIWRNNTIVGCDSVLLVKYNQDKQGAWIRNNQLINNSNGATYKATQDGTYKFLYPLSNGCFAESSPIDIKLKVAPPVYISGKNMIYCGVRTSLYASNNVYYNIPYTYQWMRNGRILANTTSNYIPEGIEGNYQVKLKTGSCESISDTFKLTTAPTNKVKFYITDYRRAFTKDCTEEGRYLDLVDVDRYSSWKYQWYFNEKPINEAGSSIKISQEGNYHVKITKDTCWGFSDTYHYKKQSPFIDVKYVLNDLNISSGQTLCDGYTVSSYSASFPFLYSQNDAPIKSFVATWYRNKKLICKIEHNGSAIVSHWTDPQFSNIYFQVSSNTQTWVSGLKAGEYYLELNVTYTDKQNCVMRSESFEIKASNESLLRVYYDIPGYTKRANISGTTPVCASKIQPYRMGYKSSWILEYRVFKDNKLVATYQELEEFEKHTISEDGLYRVSVAMLGGCELVAPAVYFKLNSLETAILPSDSLNYCKGDRITLKANVNFEGESARFTYDWIKDGKTTNTTPNLLVNSPGVYQLKVQYKSADGNTCVGLSEKVTLKHTDIPNRVTTVDSTTFCEGKFAKLNIDQVPADTLFYQWQQDKVNILSANQSSLQANSSGSYRALIQRGKCLDYTESIQIKTLANIPATASISGDQSIDYGKEAKLKVDLGSHAPWTFKLSDGQEFTAQKTPFEITVNPLSTTSYTLSEVKNICGTGTVSGTAKVTVLVLGIEEESGILIEVFPVPTSDYLTWKVRTDKPASYDLRLSDSQGRVLEVQHNMTRSQAHEGQMNISTLSTGVYFLQLTVGDKTFSRKVIKE